MSASISSSLRLPFRLAFGVTAPLLVVLAVACGGAEDQGAKSPNQASSSGETNTSSGGAGASSGGGSSSGGGASPSGPSSGGGPTTTTQLGDGGDLQGAKLGGKVHSETESKGESGPKSTGGQSASEPGRGQNDIKTMIEAKRDQARACYDKALPAHPGIEGDLDVKWLIDPQGNVTDASVDTSKSQILEPSVGACIIEIVKKIKFAASAKGYETRAHYPFNFHPKAGGGKDAGK